MPLPPRPLHLDAYAPDPSFPEIFPTADAIAIADQCAQLGHMRETKGKVSYPEWWGDIGILAYSEDGERLSQEWSSGHPNYTRRETQQKFDDWGKADGPTTCAYFQGLDDEARVRCEACPHKSKIKSPVDLGRPGGAAASVEVATPARTAATSPREIIAQLNQRHFLIRNIGGKCLVGEMVPNPIGRGQMLLLQSREDFRAWNCNQFVTVSDSQGNSKRKPVGEYWLQHRDRRGYEGVDLVPNAPRDLPGGSLNLWRGFGVTAKPGDWSLMFRHICFVLAAGDRRAAEYILRWAAWIVRHPGERAEVALVFKGAKGCGKGVFVRALAHSSGSTGCR